DRFPLRQIGRIRAAARVRAVCADGNFHGPEDGAGSATALVSLALCRRRHHGGGDQRTRLPGYRGLWPSARPPTWRAAAVGTAMEIRLQVNQVDRALQLYRQAPEGFVGSVAACRVWLLGERQSAGTASALESGYRRDYRHR